MKRFITLPSNGNVLVEKEYNGHTEVEAWSGKELTQSEWEEYCEIIRQEVKAKYKNRFKK